MKSFNQIREGTFTLTVRGAGPRGKDLNVKVKGRDKNDAVKQWRMKNKKYKNDEVEIKEGKITDKTNLTWWQVNRAMLDAGISPRDVLKVLSMLSRRIK